MDQHTTSKGRKHLQLRKQTANLQNNKKDRKASRMAIKRRKVFGTSSACIAERQDDPSTPTPSDATKKGLLDSHEHDCRYKVCLDALIRHMRCEDKVKQIEAQLSQRVRQGDKIATRLNCTAYILYSKCKFLGQTDSGKRIEHTALHEYEQDRLVFERFNRRGKAIRVTASLWLSWDGPCERWQGTFEGLWPNDQIPALEEVPVIFYNVSTKQNEDKPRPLRVHLVFLRDGCLRLKIYLSDAVRSEEFSVKELFAIEAYEAYEGEGGPILYIVDDELETTESSGEDATDTESNPSAGDYEMTRQEHAKREARAKAMERWIEERIASGVKKDNESPRVRWTGLEDYVDITWDLYSTAYLDMLLLGGKEFDDKVFDGYSCGEFSFDWDDYDSRYTATLELRPSNKSWTGDFEWDMKKGAMNSGLLNATISDEDFGEDVGFRICFVKGGKMKIRIPAYEIGGRTEDGFIDFYAVYQDASDAWTVYQRYCENISRGLEYDPPTSAGEDSPSECSDYSEDPETFDSCNDW